MSGVMSIPMFLVSHMREPCCVSLPLTSHNRPILFLVKGMQLRKVVWFILGTH
jgi:hypothetical protein